MQARKERCKILCQSQKGSPIIGLVGDRLQLRAKCLFALDCQVRCMTRLTKTRFVGILRDEQQISASRPDQATPYKAGSCNWALLGDPIRQARCTYRAHASIDNGMCPSDQQLWPIQYT